MPGIIMTELGKISIPEDIVATIAGYAASENYGIVGMSAKTTGDQLWQLVGGDNHKRGVKVTVLEDGESVDIDLYVTVVYGTSLAAVARNAIENVRYRVSEMTGIRVVNVNIHVEAIRA
ncbi:MAG: Asp23/Gls24 family envelope stress response protein [Clostridiales bacterium]|nr:Asp23/Gls24 family envelope stress response protein [Clostridiales bacterium]